MNEPLKTRRTFTGLITSHRMDKTIVVLVERQVPHPKYGKYIKRRSKILAHDESNMGQPGDKVMIQEYRPLSKRKSWILVKILEKAAVR